MAAFIASPVWGAIITVFGAAVVALVGFIWRLLVKVDQIGSKVDAVAADVVEIKEDKNIMRWSDIGGGSFRRRHRGL